MVWIAGHRGSPTVEIENTLPSFERALTHDGANALEMDICVTKDGELLVWHDLDPSTLEARLRRWGLEPEVRCRPRPFSRPVYEMTLAEARASLGYADRKSDRLDAHLPTLGEVLDWSHAHPRLELVFLDVKITADRLELVPAFLRRLDELVARTGSSVELVIECAVCEVASAIRRAGARYPLALDAPTQTKVEEAYRLDVDWVCAQRPRLGRSLWPFRRQKKIVSNIEPMCRCAFTVNDADQMRALLTLGVDAIQTDVPALLRATLDEEAAARAA